MLCTMFGAAFLSSGKAAGGGIPRARRLKGDGPDLPLPGLLLMPRRTHPRHPRLSVPKDGSHRKIAEFSNRKSANRKFCCRVSQKNRQKIAKQIAE